MLNILKGHCATSYARRLQALEKNDECLAGYYLVSFDALVAALTEMLNLKRRHRKSYEEVRGEMIEAGSKLYNNP